MRAGVRKALHLLALSGACIASRQLFRHPQTDFVSNRLHICFLGAVAADGDVVSAQHFCVVLRAFQVLGVLLCKLQQELLVVPCIGAAGTNFELPADALPVVASVRCINRISYGTQ